MLTCFNDCLFILFSAVLYERFPDENLIRRKIIRVPLAHSNLDCELIVIADGKGEVDAV